MAHSGIPNACLCQSHEPLSPPRSVILPQICRSYQEAVNVSLVFLRKHSKVQVINERDFFPDNKCFFTMKCLLLLVLSSTVDCFLCGSYPDLDSDNLLPPIRIVLNSGDSQMGDFTCLLGRLGHVSGIYETKPAHCVSAAHTAC